jgi:DedD protein
MFKQKSDPANAKLEPADAVQQARTRARQRLIGAIVLLAVGIIGFPLVFETQPRPIPVDVPIEIPRRDTLPPLAMPPPRPAAARTAPPDGTASAASTAATAAPTSPMRTPSLRASDAVITESSADAGRDVAAPRAAPASERAASRPLARAASAAEPAKAPVASAVAAASRPAAGRAGAEGERARALLEARPVASAEEQRFVVQVGAFADAEAARATRRQVEKLGLKTYTQVAQTPAGNRIRVRVGPFASRGEAETALAKAKAAGLTAVLLAL